MWALEKRDLFFLPFLTFVWETRSPRCAHVLRRTRAIHSVIRISLSQNCCNISLALYITGALCALFVTSPLCAIKTILEAKFGLNHGRNPGINSPLLDLKGQTHWKREVWTKRCPNVG